MDNKHALTDYAADTAVMNTYGRAEIAFLRGNGCWLESETHERYLDCASGIAVNTLGHSHPRLVAALQVQAGKLWHTSNLYRIPCLLYTSPSPRDATLARMPSSA